MRPNPQSLADLITFAEEILNGKIHFLCSAIDKTVNEHCSVLKPKAVGFSQELLPP